jgi:S1-C subfamily serine protease
MRRSLIALLICLYAAPIFAESKPNADLNAQALKAVALLYKQESGGGLRMLCTATAFEKTAKGYLVVSASHCVGDDDDGKAADPTDTNFYITLDDPKNKTFYAAIPKGVGYQHRGDDFAYFEVETKDELSIIPLGDESEETVGGDVTNVSSPFGLGKQLFHGSISSLKLERPVIVDSINWRDAILLQISGPGPGSSGSAIISQSQKKIVAFLVGTVGGTSVVCIPVSKFKSFRASVEKGLYKWYKPNAETESDEDSKSAGHKGR